jgi:hypothetical protein
MIMLRGSWIVGGVTLMLASGCGSSSEPVSHVATHLTIVVQPSGLSATSPLQIQPVVEVRDDNETVVTTGSYVITVKPGAGGSVQYNGDTHSVNGVLHFTDLRASGPAGMQLTFAADGLRSAFSNPMQ